MLRSLSGALLILLLSTTGVWAVGEARLIPIDWPAEATYEFAIFDSTSGTRIATAYYRLLQEVSEGEPVYHIKYMGRNELISEAAECWVRPGSMLPVRSTRKVVAEGQTYYQDNAYSDGMVVVRRKVEDGEVIEQRVPAPGPIYDYEQLMWLVPHIEFGNEREVFLNLFVSIRAEPNPATVIVADLGERSLGVFDDVYTAHGYGFEVNMTPHELWTVLQDGRPVPARFITGQNAFVNMDLDPAKAGMTPEATPASAPAEQVEEEPEPLPEEPEEAEEEPEEQPSDPHVNPLGPPPPGSRF